MLALYVTLAAAIAAMVYFLFLRRPAAPHSLPERVEEKPLPAPTTEKAEGVVNDAHSPAISGPVAVPSIDGTAPHITDAATTTTPADVEPEIKSSGTERPSLIHHQDIGGLRRGLSKARSSEGFFGRLRALFSQKRELDANLATELEEVLLSSDVGVATTHTLLERLKQQLSAGELSNEEQVWSALRTEALRVLEVGHQASINLGHHPTVILMVGVNGAGKTTTIGKLATRLKAEGKAVVLAAADTFRAAAVQQLMVWGDRVGVPVIHGKDGADPGSVVFDAIKHAEQTGADVVLADTAGRLHTKSNLMAELSKLVKTAGKALTGAPHEILLVLDATNGQNALAQAREFRDALPLTGLVLTKLDGTAKGGVILGICDELKLPVRFIGLGEKATDVRDFDEHEFVEALLGNDE